MSPARWLVGAFGLLVLLTAGLAAMDQARAQGSIQPVPSLEGRVTDLGRVLGATERQELEQLLAGLEARKGSQLAVLIVPTTRPEAIEQYSIRVVEAWKLGRKGVDDGILLLVATQDRELRIEVGYGLEGAIPDALAKRVIEEIIVPRFKSGDVAGGIRAGVEALIGLAEGERFPAPAPRSGGISSLDIDDAIPAAMMFVFLGGGILRAILGRLAGASVAGSVAFVGGWLLLGSFLVGAAVALVVFLLVLAGGHAGLGRRGGSRSSSGGGFGGGGFSGGGGGFGGGGASGRW